MARRRFWVAVLILTVAGIVAGAGEVLHLTWFVRGTVFRPMLLLYAVLIDGGLGLVVGATVGGVLALWTHLTLQPARTSATIAPAVTVREVWAGQPAPAQAISRRTALRLGVVAGSAALLGAGAMAWTGTRRAGAQVASPASPSPSGAILNRPNIMLVTLDTIRADYVGAYGNQVMKTPSLDQVASQGARFDLHMIQEPQTNPSHASMFTGMYPSSSGIRVHMVDKLPPNLDTLATLFSAAGYATAGLYSWLSFDAQYCGFDRGFDTYQNVAGQKSSLLDKPALRGLGARFRVAEQYLAAPHAFSQRVGVQQQMEWTDKGRADITTDAAIAQLQVLAGQPFFLWVHYFDAHYPYVPPAGYAEEYDPGYNGPVNSSMDVIDRIQNGELTPAGADLKKLQSLYQGEITFMDGHLGRLFGALDGMGLSDKTVLAVTADHGEAFGEHPQGAEGVDFFHPHSLHNEEQRTPLMLRYPGQIKAGATVQAPTQAIDLFPTLLQLAHVHVPDQAQGTSLVGLLDGSDSGGDRAAFASMPDYTFTSVTVPGWKFIQNNANGGNQLFDLRSDPAEANDVSGAQSDTTKQLAAKAQAWMKAAKIS